MELFLTFSFILTLSKSNLASTIPKNSQASALVDFKNLVRRGPTTSRINYRPYSSEFKMNYIGFNCDKRVYLLYYLESIAQTGMHKLVNGEQDQGSTKIGPGHHGIYNTLYKNKKESDENPYYIHQIPGVWHDEDVVEEPDFVVSAIDGALIDVITLKKDMSYEKCTPIRNQIQGSSTLTTSKSTHFDGWGIYEEHQTE